VQLNGQGTVTGTHRSRPTVADTGGETPKGRHTMVSSPDVIFPAVAIVEIALVAGETMEFDGIPRIMERMSWGASISRGRTKSLTPKATCSP